MNKTINELVALTELANDDELIVYDVSEGISKKIKKSDFVTTTIASGNQKPPTSNAVVEALVTEVSDRNTAINNAINTEVTNRNIAIQNACGYASVNTEFNTGTKWVDGKVIYGIVYLETQRASGSNTITTRTDIDTPIEAHCITYTNKYNERQNGSPWVESTYEYACRMTNNGTSTKFETYVSSGMQTYTAPISNVYTVWYYTKV